jgi:hypothetical protein
MKRWILIASCVAVAHTWAMPVGAAELSRVPTGGMKIAAVAKGDCAKSATAIVVTDTTTTCSIEISITPAKNYRDVAVLEPRSRTSFIFPTWTENDGKVKVSKKGKGSVSILKTAAGCVVVSGTAKVIAQVTNASKFGGSFTASAKSKPITVTYQQSEPAIGTCFRTVSGS